MATSNILILGASGQTGSESVDILSTAGFPVRVTYREHSELQRMREKAVEDVQADFDDVESLKRAMDGIERVLVIQSVSPEMLQHAQNINEAAKAASVSHVIRISNIAIGNDIPSEIAQMHYQADELLKSLGCNYTIIKGANYFQNMFYSALTIIRNSHFALPLGAATLSQVDARDISRVGAYCLIDQGHENKTYTITGSEAMTMHVVARKLSKVVNKEIRYIAVEPVAATQVFKDQGLPEWHAKAIGTMFMEYASGKYKFLTEDFQNITGDQPPHHG